MRRGILWGIVGLLFIFQFSVYLHLFALTPDPSPGTGRGETGVRGRFFLEGDGQLTLANKKTGQRSTIRYRLPDGSYPESGQKQIDRIFGIPAKSPESISLRFVSLLDYLQDHFTCRGEPTCSPGQTHGSAPTIQIVSGYRSPTYNDNLRKNGKLAAKTSLHIEGMAADIDMAGVTGETLWNYVRGLNCCGAGYYHGRGIHVDTGPTRFWDETSTKVETDISTHNKMIMVQTDQDIYRPGEVVKISLSRITDYPIGIKMGGKCQILKNRTETKNIPWVIVSEHWTDRIHSVRPSGANALVHGNQMGILKGRAVSPLELIEVEFCQKPFPEMPERIKTNEFIIQ